MWYGFLKCFLYNFLFSVLLVVLCIALDFQLSDDMSLQKMFRLGCYFKLVHNEDGQILVSEWTTIEVNSSAPAYVSALLC